MTLIHHWKWQKYFVWFCLQLSHLSQSLRTSKWLFTCCSGQTTAWTEKRVEKTELSCYRVAVAAKVQYLQPFTNNPGQEPTERHPLRPHSTHKPQLPIWGDLCVQSGCSRWFSSRGTPDTRVQHRPVENNSHPRVKHSSTSHWSSQIKFWHHPTIVSWRTTIAASCELDD